MALSKKRSRIINIDGDSYRWVISPQKNKIILVAELDAESGRRIEVFIDSDIDQYWVNFPYTSHLNLKIIRPKDVAEILREALTIGWNPREKGTPLVFEHSENSLFLKKKS